jgi:hypothetical protein
MDNELQETKRKLRKANRFLSQLQHDCFTHLRRLDEAMRMPESYERGKIIAMISNDLEMANDSVRHFYLDMPIDASSKEKEWQKIKQIRTSPK